MTIQNPQWMTAIVIFMGLMVLGQAIGLFVTLLILDSRLKKLAAQIDPLMAKANQMLQQAQGILSMAENLQEKLPILVNSVNGAVDTLMGSVQRADREAEKALNFIRGRVQRASGGLDGILNRFSHQTYRVHRAVLEGTVQISAIVQAGIAVLRRFFSSNEQKDPPYSLPDKEIFI